MSCVSDHFDKKTKKRRYICEIGSYIMVDKRDTMKNDSEMRPRYTSLSEQKMCHIFFYDGPTSIAFLHSRGKEDNLKQIICSMQTTCHYNSFVTVPWSLLFVKTNRLMTTFGSKPLKSFKRRCIQCTTMFTFVHTKNSIVHESLFSSPENPEISP